MQTKTSKRLFRDDLKSLFRSYKGQIIRITILSAFLFFFLHLFIGISFYGNSINAELKDKLGMYFYIKDDPENEDIIYKRVMQLKEQLQNEQIKVSFSTKEDSVKFLEKRLPELTKTFEKFKIKNPLPATLYVTFRDQDQYEVLQRIMLENKELILNIQDLTQVKNLEEQEGRILNVIKLSNFVQLLCWIFVGVLIFVVLSFIIFFLKGLFTTFKKDIQVKKLLGATASQVIQPFLRVILFTILIGFVIALILTGGTLFTFDYYMGQVFTVTLLPYLYEHRINVVILLLIELNVIIILSMIISYHYVHRLHKKLK